jgi:inner membrane protein
MKGINMSQETVKSSVGIKLLIIGGLVLLLLIPTIFIQLTISERKSRKNEVINEISSRWGQEQTLVGPVLTLPVQYIKKDEFGNDKPYTKHIYLFPENLNYAGNLNPEIRYLSIYEIPVYTTELNITGNFNLSSIDERDLRRGEILYEQAKISFEISDMKGIGNQVELQWYNQNAAAQPGPHHCSILKKGFHFPAPLQPEVTDYQFSLPLQLKGTRNINFVPLGKKTSAHITSSWKHPGFTGEFLPRNREISSSGFTADWEIYDLNRNIPTYTDNREFVLNTAVFGIALVTPVDQYQQTTRSVKYAILFIGLTFLAFFLIEVLNGKQLHPMQYLLIGSGLIIFYILLLSLSEHLSFILAYTIASASLVILISLYSRAILHDRRFMGVIAGILIALYGFLFINLQLEDYALLLGSISLFLILAAVMYLTRNLNWYTLNSVKGKEGIEAVENQ